MICTVPVCKKGFIYEKTTDKCYECLGELGLNGEKYQCVTAIGSECRFKCKDDYVWYEEEEICVETATEEP